MILGEQGELLSSLGWSPTDGEGRRTMVDMVRDCLNLHQGCFISTFCFHGENYELYCIIVNYTHNLTRPNPLIYLMTLFFFPCSTDWLKTHFVDQNIQSLRECLNGIHHDPGLATCNLMCCIPGGHKEMDTIEQLHNNNRWTCKCLFSSAMTLCALIIKANSYW